MDPRIETLARTLLTYSLDLRPGEKLFIEGETGCEPLVQEMLRQAYDMGVVPFVELTDPRVRRAWLQGATAEQQELKIGWDIARIKAMDARLFLFAGGNQSELDDVPSELLQVAAKARKPYMDIVLTKKWALARYPTAGAAQAAGMSTEAYEDFCFSVSALDYGAMSRAMDPLVELMERTDQVRVLSPGTDLTFSIKGIPVRKADGRENVPDGEVFTAPVRDSASGTITYNTASREAGALFEHVSFVFEQGRIVEATGSPKDKLTTFLDTDEGARYLGEFALGLNPAINLPVQDILFDEKIAGSLHLTPGEAYEEADNGNRSAVHWDLVLIQTPEWGGGEIWFDGVLVRKDGRFVLPELEGLNPERLL